MKRHWKIDELIEHFTFLPNDLSQIGTKSCATRFGFAVLFNFFQYEVRFPVSKIEIPKEVLFFFKTIEYGLFTN